MNPPAAVTSKQEDKDDDVERPLEVIPLPLKEEKSSPQSWFIVFGFIIALVVVAVTISLSVSQNSGQESQLNFDNASQPIFDSSLGLWDANVARGYDNERELEDDLASAARFLLNNVVSRNLGLPGFQNTGLGRSFANPEGGDAPVEMDASGAPPEAQQTSSNLDDFGTNNQEDGVEEGDRIVSDGKYVFAAYGDILLVWDADTGSNITQIKMPTPEDGSRLLSSAVVGPFSARVQIQELLLEKTRLVVIVGGYGAPPGTSRKEGEESKPVLFDLSETRLYVYDTSALAGEGMLTEVFQSNINGRYNAIRGVGDFIHVTTMSTIDTYSHLIMPFERWSMEKDLSDTDYLEMTRELADVAIPSFTTRLLSELTFNNKLPDFARITQMQEQSSGTILDQVVYGDGLVNSVAQVFSLDIGQDFSGLDESDSLVSVSGAFLPVSYGQVYSAQHMLILASNGYNFDVEKQLSTESTYLLGFELNSASTTPQSVGVVKGHFLSTHSIDVKGRYLRIATTTWNTFWAPLEEPPNNEDPDPVVQESNTENFIYILEMPQLSGSNASGTMEHVSSLQLGKVNEVFTAVRFFDNIAYAVTFERTDPFYVLDLDDPANPVILGELEIPGFSSYLHSMNDDNSLILAIGQDAAEDGTVLGLMITVFDVRDPANPVIAQRLTLEQDENTWSGSSAAWDFKSVRFEKTTQRLIIPVRVNNWEDPSQNFHGFIVFIANQNTVQESCRIEHSDWDYTPVEAEPGVMVAPPVEMCWYCAQLPQRSMIFRGNVMTTNGHFVRSTSLDSCEELWALDVTIQSEGACCDAFF